MCHLLHKSTKRPSFRSGIELKTGSRAASFFEYYVGDGFSLYHSLTAWLRRWRPLPTRRLSLALEYSVGFPEFEFFNPRHEPFVTQCIYSIISS